MKKIIVVIAMCLISIVSLFSGCFVIQKEQTQFSISSFRVEPNVIHKGDSANLSWVVLAATSVAIDNGIGSVDLTGYRTIVPTQTTSYTLTASNATLTKTAMVTVIIMNESNESEELRIVSFEVTPSVIDVGGSANLSWVVIDATSVSIDNKIGNVTLSGHWTVHPMGTTTYTLTASNPMASKFSTVQVFVRSEQVPPQTPNIAFTTDSTNHKMTVATSDAGVKWSDIIVTLNPSGNFHYQVWYNGGQTAAGAKDSTVSSAIPEGTTVTAGDYIQLTADVENITGTNVVVTLRYIPTNSLLGTWTIHV